MDGTPITVAPVERDGTSTEVRSFTSEDLERALAKQKEEHDASLEALVQIKLASLTTGTTTFPRASRPHVHGTSFGQPPPERNQTSVPWLYARSQIEKPKYNP